MDVTDERIHEGADVFKRPAPVAGWAPPVAPGAGPHRRLVLVAVGTHPPRIHHVVSVDLGRTYSILAWMPFRCDVRCRRGERRLPQRACWAGVVGEHAHR